jgi:hypothetical protein
MQKVYVIIRGNITWHGSGTLCKLDEYINAVQYIEILDNQLWPVIARHFPNYSSIFQYDCVCRAGIAEGYKQDNIIHGML